MSPNARKDVPAYALAIRELRQKTGLTQPELAAELGVKRVSVARWEGGAFEPNAANYQSLVEAAKKHKLPELADFFHWTSYQNSYRAHWAQRMEEGKRFFLRTRKQAEAGDEAARKIIQISKMDREEEDKYGVLRREEFRGLFFPEIDPHHPPHGGSGYRPYGDPALLAKWDEYSQEAARVHDFKMGRRVFALELFGKLRLQLDQLPAIKFPGRSPSETSLREAEQSLDKRRELLDRWKNIVATLGPMPNEGAYPGLPREDADRIHYDNPQSDERALAMMEEFEAMLGAERGAEAEPEEPQLGGADPQPEEQGGTGQEPNEEGEPEPEAPAPEPSPDHSSDLGEGDGGKETGPKEDGGK
jgi:transcriptional regulator with XRE-family HTH domain